MGIESNLLKSLKVLYVEDEEEVLEQMQFFLKKRVGRLITAQNGKEGIASFKENFPDMVISDLKMPVMDGISMARELRKVSDVPIIITTAFSDQDMILKAVDVGIEKYIIKPLDAKELLEAMEKISVKILRNKGELLAVRNMALTKEDKLRIEEGIKNAMAKLIKEKTGKGPQNVKAFIHARTLEIEIVEVLTKMEKTLLEKEKNTSMVKYGREVFYKDHEEGMKRIVKEFVPWDIQLASIDMDFLNDKNRLKFMIV
ncbi:YesN/AraC family two-component response regulator [Anaerosolibacter carboniphilus]|uniref:Stage 0 sporulation protein A homolog n=1 Tax=Anaerosolibacter carboniphilus TaxID=1417629 RepID=A0A841KYM6_9FIRM|nr:Na-translocating system protein MpsC family protein [Anaerosolibacter carboniphilus]MBB6215235.1 YesN/AraC family two-component response regulator [Anaerosolibacter carboniphilus]